jgi:ADP-ribose pyrophosphatase YjhB (NUDIX family)
MSLITRLLPIPLHRLALRIAHRLRMRWWRLARSQVKGLNIVALDAAGQVLLVRHSYGNPEWLPPSGGYGRHEDPAHAAVRELGEETGCRIEDMRCVAVEARPFHGEDDLPGRGACNLVHVFVGRTAGLPRIDGREILEARFFAIAELPPGLKASVPGWIAAWRTSQPIDRATTSSGPPGAHSSRL